MSTVESDATELAVASPAPASAGDDDAPVGALDAGDGQATATPEQWSEAWVRANDEPHKDWGTALEGVALRENLEALLAEWGEVSGPAVPAEVEEMLRRYFSP